MHVGDLPRRDQALREGHGFLAVQPGAPGAVALAPRRAALAAVQPADRPARDRRLTAGPTVALAPGGAARHGAQVAAPVAFRPHPNTGHEVGSAILPFWWLVAPRRGSQGGEIEPRSAVAVDPIERREVDGHEPDDN